MDRITRIRIKNVRAIESVDLELGRPLTVLIGENGSCKSTIIECFELLMKAAEPTFMQLFFAQHRGLPGLLRKGATTLRLGVVIEDDEGKHPRLEYDLTIGPLGSGATVVGENLRVGPAGGSQLVIERGQAGGQMLAEASGTSAPIPGEALRADQLTAVSFGSVPPHKAILRLLAALRGIEVHLGFDTLAAWAARAAQRQVVLRGGATLFPAQRLDLLGMNLANAWSELRTQSAAHLERTLELVRLGLGERVDTVVTKPDAGGGNIYLAVLFKGMSEPVHAADLSDGQLAWLSFVALARLNAGRSFLAIDEPELHLHPHLVGGVISLLQTLEAPVLLATHADRILELLDDPASAVRVCTLDDKGRAAVGRLDAAELPRWLEKFGDLGQLRASGYLPRVVQTISPQSG